MASDTALGFIRAAARGAKLPAAIVIAGSSAFLRERVFDAARRTFKGEGMNYRSFLVGGGDTIERVIAELREADLFAARRIVACRVLRSHRERDSGEEEEGGAERGTAAGSEAALAEAIASAGIPGAFILLYERDTAPAKVRRSAETHGMLVNCARPYENQLSQYAEVLAAEGGVKLAGGAAEALAARFGDLPAIANALARAAIHQEPGATLDVAALTDPAAARVPAVFELAESISRGDAAEALAILGRAIAFGRDPVELLAVEMIPVMRRMMLAAAVLERRGGPAQISAVLGFSPTSPLLTRAAEGARRYGLARLKAASRRACELDAGFKSGLFQAREEALGAMLLELMVGAGQAAASRARR